VLLALLLAAAPIHYRVVASGGAKTLSVEVKVPAGYGPSFSLDERVAGFVDKPANGAGMPCSPKGCTLRYRFRLADAAEQLQSRAWAFADGEGLYASPSTWLVKPNTAPADARFSLSVELPKGWSFVTGLHHAAAVGTWEGPLTALDDAPWSGFAAFALSSVSVGGAKLEVAIAPGALALTPEQVRAWVSRSAGLVSMFYGRFPVSQAAILVLPSNGDGVGFGTAMGNGGASVLIWVGATATPDALAHDWVLPHELTHFAFPSLPRENNWLEEGLATWVEPLIRVRMGEISADEFWATLIAKLPLGLPAKGDEGLDHTPTWGRTYWGGALFCFVAELEIRAATKNLKGLDAALRAVVAAGGNQEAAWPIARALEVGDAALGTPVLGPLHERLGGAPGDVDLPALFKRLGVAVVKGKVVYDDEAPDAAIRKALTARIP
jgi:predicted metalloprotease with PDZ domain